MITPAEAAQEILDRRAARKSLIAYTRYTMPGFEEARHHRFICQKLEEFVGKVLRKESPRLMIFEPPRHTKTELVSKRLPAWFLGQHPEMQYMSASYNDDFASDIGREVRNIFGSQEHLNVFPAVSLRPDSKAANRWHTNEGGIYVSIGVGGAGTGRGAHIFGIDDPFKDWAEASSETIRNRKWDWFTSVVRTRMMPGGGIIVTHCMTGDTPVLMADGSTTALCDIKKGDKVATYDSGHLSVSTVLNHKSSGRDYIFKITTTCGKIVRANARHPFLIEGKGGLEWVKLGNLSSGQKIVTLKDSGASGRGSFVQSKGAKSQSVQEGFVLRTMSKLSGLLGIGHHRQARNQGAGTRSKRAMVSRFLNTTLCLLPKTANVPFADNPQVKTLEHIGTANCALTTAMTQARSELYCATTATSPSDTPKQRPSRLLSPNISEFTTAEIELIEPDGIEEVFDVHIDRTENFIANGLVSHNTRWSDDDIAGRLLKKMEEGGEQWDVISLPAIALENDQLGRNPGEALWPEWYGLDALEQIKSTLSPMQWNALYQQNPIPDEGDYFKTDCCQWYEKPPKHLRLYGASDYAVTDDGGDFTEHGVFGLDPNDDLYILDWWYGQKTSDVWIEELLDLVQRHRPVRWYGESGVIKRAVEPTLLRRSRERKVYCDWQWLSSITDKPTRARGFQARWSMRKVYLPANAPWAARLLRQLSRFPAGAEDDGVDVCSLIGRALDDIFSANVPNEAERKRRQDYSTPDEDDDEDGWKVA